ncbi:MAG: hypothetical protein DA330_04760 [Nitrososphaera sp.]|nr:hypothetical protein [Nitrososphaera sp.]
MSQYRKMTRDERTMLNRALDRWGVFEIMKEKNFLIKQDDNVKKVCLVSDEQALLQQFCESGLVIGEMTKQFAPTLQGADLFFRSAGCNNLYVKVNENAEKLVLYGRDVMGDSIIDAPKTLSENVLVAIINSNREVIGLGRTRFGSDLVLQKGKITITTISDAGQYLRDEDDEKSAKMTRSR